MKKQISATLLCASLSYIQPTMPAFALDQAQKEEIGAFIQEYLLANPDLLEKMQDALIAKQQNEQTARAKTTIKEHKDAIFNAPEDIVLGNPKGDVTIVEFYDYNCGYCKRALADMNTLIEEDENLRFVLKELPVLGPDSVAAHRVAIAFRELMPEKAGEFHRQLLSAKAQANEDTAMAVATGLGADETALRAGMNAPEVADSMHQAYKLADLLGISGTPSYVVGNETIFGAQGTKILKEKIANARACNSTGC